MHQHHYAHRWISRGVSDCTGRNIMMDNRKLYPKGFHSIDIDHDYKRNRSARRWTRTERPPKYLLIDFGLSQYCDPELGPPLDLPVRGIDRSVPEIQGEKFNELNNLCDRRLLPRKHDQDGLCGRMYFFIRSETRCEPRIIRLRSGLSSWCPWLRR